MHVRTSFDVAVSLCIPLDLLYVLPSSLCATLAAMANARDVISIYVRISSADWNTRWHFNCLAGHIMDTGAAASAACFVPSDNYYIWSCSEIEVRIVDHRLTTPLHLCPLEEGTDDSECGCINLVNNMNVQ